MDKKLIFQLATVFVLAHLFGLMIAGEFIVEDVTAGFASEDPNSLENTGGLFLYIIVVTAVFLFIVVYLKITAFAYLLEFVAILSATLLFLALFLPGAELAVAVPLIALRYLLPQNIHLKNILALAAVSVAGPLIGVSLGIIPIVVFLLVISVYDLIAVFKTKHMVKMAKTIIKRNMAFTFTFHAKNRDFELGTGDIAIPLAFAASVLKFSENPFLLLPFVMAASLFGILLTLKIAEEKKIPLPALPIQGILMVGVWFISTLIPF